MSTRCDAQPQRSVLNITLWTIQVLLGIFWSISGLGKMLCLDDRIWSRTLPQVPWFSAIPQSLFVFIGLSEFLGGVGLILPGLSGIKPRLTSFAAIGLTVVMVLAAGFHIMRGEYHGFLPFNLIMATISAFIAYGRLYVRPLAPTSGGTVRALWGVAVLCALVLAGVAPVWQLMTHSH